MNNSKLFDEKEFYTAFIYDLDQCSTEVIIESPYITSNRMKLFYPVFYRLLAKGVSINVITRLPNDHDNEFMRNQAEFAIHNFERMGVQALLCRGNHHRKLAILDQKILWEGSLNILSQSYSREIMKRTEGKEEALQMFNFLKLSSVL